MQGPGLLHGASGVPDRAAGVPGLAGRQQVTRHRSQPLQEGGFRSIYPGFGRTV